MMYTVTLSLQLWCDDLDALKQAKRVLVCQPHRLGDIARIAAQHGSYKPVEAWDAFVSVGSIKGVTVPGDADLPEDYSAIIDQITTHPREMGNGVESAEDIILNGQRVGSVYYKIDASSRVGSWRRTGNIIRYSSRYAALMSLLAPYQVLMFSEEDEENGD